MSASCVRDALPVDRDASSTARDTSASDVDDPWEIELNRWLAGEVLARLAPQHRADLTLRYLDGLSVPEAASILERSMTATEALLVRARREFRHLYEGSTDA